MGPFLKDDNSTSKMMKHLLISLLPIILFAFVKNGILPYTHGSTNIFGMFYPLIFILIATLSTFVFETLYGIFILKRDIKDLIKNTYSFFPGLFLGLILPINTPIIMVILGSFVASIIAKMLFGGFGNNIFNPALVGRFFIILIYVIVMGRSISYLNSYEIDTISKSTPLSNASSVSGIGDYDLLVKPYGGLSNFFFGNIPGTLGEVSSFLCLLAFIYLTFFKVIKWKIPVTYILTVFAITYVIGGINNQGIWYPLFQIFSGGLMFGAVFMATDPVTTPTTPIGQILYGLFLGILTVIFRFLTPFPEGVLLSILIMNAFVFILDRVGALARFNVMSALVPFFVAWVLILFLGIGISMHYQNTNEEDFNIISKDESGNRITYVVNQKGYNGFIKASIVIESGKIVDIDILEQNDSFYFKIEDNNYINKLIDSNGSSDTVSGATITSSALKTMVKNTLKDYGYVIEEPVIENKDEESVTDNDEPVTENKEESEVENKDASIISKNYLDDGSLEYIVTSKGFHGDIKLQVLLVDGHITSVNVLEQNDSYFKFIINSDYINTVINNGTDVDVVSGATYTSNGIKRAIKLVLDDYAVN